VEACHWVHVSKDRRVNNLHVEIMYRWDPLFPMVGVDGD